MKTFFLEITSPDGSIFRGEAVGLFVRGTEGDLAVLAGHIPFITTVKPCECRIELEDGSEKTGHTEGGLLTVKDNGVTFLSGTFEW